MINRKYIGAVAVVIVMLAAASIACNVQFGSAAPTPLPPLTAKVGFIAPANNATLAEGSLITLAVSVVDSGAGVAKVDFSLDGAMLGSTVASPIQQNFTARFDWIATGVQGHLITADAFRANGEKIGEAGLTVQVIKRPEGVPIAVAALPTNTPVVGANPAATAASTPPANAPTATLNTVFVAPTSAPVTIQPGGPVLIPATATAAQVAISIPTTPTPNTPPPILEVTFDKLNVREGPDTNYKQIGEIPKGEKARVLGRNKDRTWVFVEWREVRGWVTSSPNFSIITGDTTFLPLIADVVPTPTPTGATNVTAPNATSIPGTPGIPGTPSAPSATNQPDLVVARWLMIPITPTAGRSFDVVVVVKNQGSVDSKQALLVGVFQPGDVRAAMDIPPLKAGQEVTLRPMTVTVASAGEKLQAVLTVDTNNEIDEGPNEANNSVTIDYKVAP